MTPFSTMILDAQIEEFLNPVALQRTWIKNAYWEPQVNRSGISGACFI
jgi:hypothetical protein